MNLNSREHGLVKKLSEALSSSLVLPEAMKQAEGLLSQLLPADHTALCVSKPGRPSDYDWMVTGSPAVLLDRYSEVRTMDFVRDSVMRHRNKVLRDTEMLPRKKLVRSPLYLRCRELGLPLEHVMSVLLDVSPDWHAGFTLYRERRRPFSERERALLQGLTTLLTHTIRNCQLYASADAGNQLLETLCQRRGAERLVLLPPSSEQLRTEGVTALLDKWFTPAELGTSGLPREWVERLRWLVRQDEDVRLGWDTWVRPGEEQNLKVTFIPLPEQRGERPWALVLQEFSAAIPLPAELRKHLTHREAQLVAGVLSNWNNAYIAEQLGLQPNTVKAHLRNVFPKLKVHDRLHLMYQAAWLKKPFH
jgi:DNA-binding CsgD family transcriptional regulator